jgi:TPR repeat protein
MPRAREEQAMARKLRIFGAACLATCLIVTPARADDASAAFDPGPLQAKAQAGDPTAQFQLGTLDYVGLGVVQDYIAAAALLKQAGAAGNGQAQCELGFLYQTGSFAQGPPPPDPADALPWYEKSAAQGDKWGEFALAALYQSGQGVKADPAQAQAWFAKAAAQGLTADPSSFPLEQLQEHFYAIAYQLTGQTTWTDLVSAPSGGGQ